MSIKSQTLGGSDIPLMSKQRAPIYKTKNKTNSAGDENYQVNNISRYVEKNMAKTVKPRGSENR